MSKLENQHSTSLKRCYSCKEEKAVNLFYKSSNACKPCESVRKSLSYDKYEYKHRERWLKVNYNLSLEGYEALVKAQNGLCSICKRRDSSGRRLAVDHSHQTGKVRGLLCLKCNRGLGCFDDNSDFLIEAAKYIKERN